jgi:hypothetical protein
MVNIHIITTANLTINSSVFSVSKYYLYTSTGSSKKAHIIELKKQTVNSPGGHLNGQKQAWFAIGLQLSIGELAARKNRSRMTGFERIFAG